MTKEHVTIEFRYNDEPKGEWDSECKSKMVTIGVFDTLEEAIIEGNKVLEILESKFELRIFPKGNKATKQRFSKTGGCFGSENRLISNLAYLKTPFTFYAKITKLKYNDVEQTIFEVLDAEKRYKSYKLLNQE